MENSKLSRRSLQERLDAGEYVICAEGYVFTFTRRGYIGTGLWTPQFVLDYPEVLREAHYDFVRAGSDVVQALQYYAHREKIRQVGKEDFLEEINRVALRTAREVAEKMGRLFAGNICNTNICKGDADDELKAKIRAMFDEQVRWAKEEGAEFIIGETFQYMNEAMIALEVIKSYGLPAVITFGVLETPGIPKTEFSTFDGVRISEACKKLLDSGAYLTGVNCSRGPEQMIEIVEDIVKVCPPEKICALPIAYRTTADQPTLFALRDESCPENDPPYPHGLDVRSIAPVEIAKFTRRCKELGLKYMGICCGNTGKLTLVMAETLGKKSDLSRYQDHSTKGTDPYKYVRK